MANHPIIFSGPMVRALLSGRKTQTRRLSSSPLKRVAVGDRLYVREAAAVASIFSDVVEVRYKASERDSHTNFVEQVPVGLAVRATPTWPKYRPSIHMPRWASRLTLTVTDVQVQPLSAVSGSDAVAEGVERLPEGGGWRDYTGRFGEALSARESFISLWDSLHDRDGERWADRPEVIALTFTVERVNIDRMAA